MLRGQTREAHDGLSELSLAAWSNGDAISIGARAAFSLVGRSCRLIHDERRDELLIFHDRETRRVKRHAVIAVRRPVDGVNDHGEFTVAGHTRLLAHDAKARSAQYAKCHFVGGDVKVVLSAAHTGVTLVLTRSNDGTDLVRALTKGPQ